MAKTADQSQVFLYDLDGETVEVAREHRDAFLRENPKARGVGLYEAGGETVEVADGDLDAFRKANPTAERVHLFDQPDGETVEVARKDVPAYIGSRAAPDKDRSWGSYAGEAYADAAKAFGRTVAAVGAGVVQGIGGTLAGLGPGDAARRERQRALDAAPERIPTMKEAGREIGLPQAEIDALPDRHVTLRDLDDPRFGQAYRDRVRATMRRVAENAPETEAEKAHREEAERLQAKADKLSAPLMEPRNAAERAAMHFGGGVATVGELGLAGALGGPSAVPLWMGATGAAREAARQEAEGASPREAMAGALAPAAAESLAWTVPLPIGPGATAAGRVGREALTMGVKSDLAGTARRTLSGEEAPALSDRLAEDLGAAAMGGALGAAREGARAAGGAVVRAVERDARERAARLAALDPATALGRAAEAVTPPEMRETAHNLEAAAVPENPMDAYARRKAAEANPASDFAGEAGREFLARGARDLERREADAARLAEEELATREAPQVAPEEVPPTVAPEVRGGVQTPPPAPEPAPAASVSPGISEWVGEYLARYEQARKRANDVFDPISGRKWGEGLPITEHDEMQRRLEGVVSGMGNDELAAVEKAADANRDAAKKIDDKNAERIWNQVSYHAAATRLMREAATKPTAREPATFPLGMDPRLGRKSIPGFVVPLEGELVPGAEIAFQGNAPGKPSVGKIVEDMGKALAVQPESGPQQIVAREEVYGIRAAVPPAEPAPAAPVAGSATPPRAESATPYTVDGAGNVGRRDGKPLTSQVAPEEVPPTVAPEARPGSTGNTGSEPAASGGASRLGEPQSPAPVPVAGSAAGTGAGGYDENAVRRERMDRDFGDFYDENGKLRTLSQLLDAGWRFEKRKRGAAYRYWLVKDGVDGYHDLSDKKFRTRIRPGNYAEDIETAQRYSEEAQRGRAPAAPAPVPASQGPGVPAAPAPVAGSATAPQAEGSTPYTVDGAGNVGRRDGKPLTPQDVKAVKKIAKAAGVNLYKDRINGNLRAPGFGLGGSGNPALSAALDGRSAEAPAAPVAEPAAALQVRDGVGPSPELDAVNRRIAQVDAELKAIQDKGGVYWGTPEHRRRSKLQEERSALGVRRARLRAEAPISGESPVAPGLSRGTDVEGRTVYRGEAPAGETARDRMPEQREWVEKAAADALKTAPERYLVGKRKPNGYADAAAMVNWESNEGPKGPVPPRTDIRFDVPGDGSFTVPNEKHAIEEWAKGLKAALNPSGLNAPSPGSGGRASRGLAKVERSAPRTFTTAQAEKLLAPFVPKSDGIRQRQDDAFAFGSREMVAFLRGVPGAKDGKWQTPVGMSKIADFRDGMPVEREGVEANVPELLRDVREAAALVDTSSELLEVPSETKARAAAEARNAEMQRPGTVRLMQGADGRIFVAAEAADGSTVETGDMNGAREIGMFNPEYLEKALSLMAQTGNGKVVVGAGKPNQSGAAPIVLRGEKGNAAVVVMPKTMPRPAAPAEPVPAPSSGSARGDVAADTPRLAETARPTTAGTKPATPDGPRTAIRSELQVLLDSGEKDPATLEDLARRAEAADAFATAALARQAAGTYRGTPWGTEGGDVWPAEPPPMAKLELGDMVDLARGLSSSGAVPKVVRRISRVLRGKAAGVFRASEGDAKSGKVELIGRLFGLVDADERASVERRATEKAEKTGADPDSSMYREAYRKAYEKGMADAIEGSMRSGPKRAMAVLSHEIGHWIDFLSEGDLKRGNVLGHIAALKRNAVQTLWRDPATAGLAGTTGWTERMREEVHRDVEKRVKRKDFASDEEYRDAYRAEMDAELLSRGLESHGVVREQMERLVAWFRQSDGAPEYFAKDPAELYAEAFSAWMNYPANARRLAPRFVQLMDDWIAAHGEAGRAVKRFQAMAAERSAAREAAAAAGGPTSDAEFFERRRKEGAAASMAEDPALRPVLSNDADPPSITRWTRRKAEFLNQAVGPRTMLEDMILGAPDAKNNPDAIPVFRALLDLDNSGNMARLWRYRFDSRVMPKLESAGIPLDDFRDYLKYSRLGNEITGPLQDRGAANKAGPGGVAPGYGATGARARVADLRAKYGPAIEDARRAFVQDVRRGADAGGEGSILGRLLDSPVLSEEQKRVLGNEWYVSLRRAMVPDTTREVSSGREMSNWNGIWSLRTGSLQETGDVIANTLLQDWTMFQQVMRQEARLRLVDYLKAHKPEWVGGEAEMKVVAGRDSDGNPFVQRVPKQQKKEGWRVVTFMRDGKAEGWWVPDFVAQALEPQTFAAERTRGAREAEAAVAALSRASNAALTTANLVFNPINALSRDPNGLSRYALPRVGEGAKGAIYNTVGDASIAVRSLANDAATRMERGQYDPRVVHALASGALNDTASGWGPNGGTRGVAGMAEDIRRTGRAELTEDEVRRFWEGFGNRPERVNAALAREGSTWKKAAGAVAKAWGMGPGRLNEWLGRREMSSKAASLADLEARRPDLSPEERAWWVKNMMGTPDLSNRPLLDRNPYVRVLAPFFTPFAHGIRYQLLRAFQKMPGTLGRRLAAQMLPKAVAVAAPAALVAMAREAAQEADEMKKGGRFSEDAVQAKLDEAARLVAVGQAWAEIPLRHRMNGFTFPLPGGRYLYAPTDQGLLAVESAVLGGIVAPMAKQGGGWEGFAGAVNEAMPNFGPLPNTLVGLATGYDLNMGREVAGEREQHPAARTAGWAWDNLTGRGLGILPSATVERWITGDGPDAGEAAKRAYSWPFLSSIPGAFVRKRGSGAWAARAGAVRQGKAEEKEMRGEAAAGAAAAAEGDAERAQQAARRIAELGGDPQARLQSAAERRNLAGSDLSPSERLVVEKKGKLSDASREWLDPMAQAMLFMPEVWQRLHEKPAD